MKRLAVVILAAGEGTRMKSATAKVLHPVMGKPMISHVVDAAAELAPSRTVVVVGVQAGQVKEKLGGSKISFALQKRQRGTADAVKAAMPALEGFSGDLVVLYGDTPLIRAQTLKELVRTHRRRKAGLTLLTAEPDDPAGYGRIIRDGKGAVIRIVEHKDADRDQKKIKEINPGLYCYDLAFLKKALPKVGKNNKQGEYYLTDLVEIAVKNGVKIASARIGDPKEIIGINSRKDLAAAAAAMRERTNDRLMLAGVTIEDPDRTWIEPDVKIGKDSVIEPDTRIAGKTVIGTGCRVAMGSRLDNARIGKGVNIKTGSVIEDSQVGEAADIGPYARLRPGSVIGKNVRIGNFVETKKAVIGEGTKSSHLSYIGDAKIGRNVNIGCGFITCNYDGKDKWVTVIEDDVFVGSDSQTVAPVKIGKGAYIGSGTTVTRDVPAEALVLARAPLAVKEGWAGRKNKSGRKKGSARKPGRE